MRDENGFCDGGEFGGFGRGVLDLLLLKMKIDDTDTKGKRDEINLLHSY